MRARERSTHEKPRRVGGVCGAERRAAGLLATVVSYKALAEFFAVRMTLAAFIANAFTAFRVLTLAGLAVVSFNAFSVFFTIAVTLAALIAHAFAAFCMLAFAVCAVMSFNAFPEFFAVAVALMALAAHVLAALLALFAISFLDFCDTALNDRGNRWRLKSGRWRRSQCECRKGEGETKTY